MGCQEFKDFGMQHHFHEVDDHQIGHVAWMNGIEDRIDAIGEKVAACEFEDIDEGTGSENSSDDHSHHSEDSRHPEDVAQANVLVGALHCTELGMWMEHVGLQSEDEGNCDALYTAIVEDFGFDVNEVADSGICDKFTGRIE